MGCYTVVMSESTIKNTPQRSSPSGSKRKPKKITDSYLHNAGLFYLQRFASSRKNFIAVMDRKIRKSCREHPEQDYNSCKLLLEKTADTFERSGLLNDTVFAEGLISSLRRRGLSRSAVLQKLQQKGIGRNDALPKLQHFDEQTADDAELQAALKFAQKKRIGPFSTKPEDDKSIKKFYSIFARGGFCYEIAQKVLKTDSDNFP